MVNDYIADIRKNKPVSEDWKKKNKGYVILKENEIKDMLSKSEQIGYEKGWQSRKDTEGRNAGEIHKQFPVKSKYSHKAPELKYQKN